jgi:benzoyl-CoA 2,3-dioxygenase component B
MVYLLHAYFGRDGREEAEELLARHSGDADRPRILSTFNEPIDDWLSFFMFTYFTDRDGKFQLMSLAESGFDPLARTCRFMLMEEALHMMVGTSGIARIIRRTLEVMVQLKTDEPDKLRAAGVVDLPTLQRYLNFWFSSSLDLFGAEVSTNAASYFASGIKGRPDEGRHTDHVCRDATLAVETPDGPQHVPLRNAMNELTRQAYLKDCNNGVQRWSHMIEQAGVDFRLRLPSPRFHRTIGAWAGRSVDPSGGFVDEGEWRKRHDDWLPSAADRAFVKGLMRAVTAPGKVAGWIAPPERGVNHQPADYEYVRLA